MGYKPKICVRCGKEFMPTGRNQKYCKECGIIVNREKHRIIRKQSYLKNGEKERQQHRLWTLHNKEHVKKYNKQYHHQYYLKNYERERPRKEQWQKLHPNRVIEIKKKNRDKRCRTLGFIPLNQYFKESAAHHIDLEHIIYIPEEYHRSVYHNQFTGQGMALINALAWDYLIETSIKDTSVSMAK